MSLGEVAIRLDWYEHRKGKAEQRPDSTRVGRVLGIAQNGSMKGSENKLVEYDTAAKLCIALDLYPIDVGI